MSFENITILVVSALLLIYLILAAQFESFLDPFTIMLTVPLALAGALLSLWIFGQTLNIFSEIGMIMLIGLVTKNGILIIDDYGHWEGAKKAVDEYFAAGEKLLLNRIDYTGRIAVKY